MVFLYGSDYNKDIGLSYMCVGVIISNFCTHSFDLIYQVYIDIFFSVRELDPLVYMLSRLAEDKQVWYFHMW